jgi:ABC-2 type transport system ATP-binding protein
MREHLAHAAVLEACALVKRFAGVHVVRGVSFSVARGEIVGCLGPNGSGKSTTFKIIVGLLDSTTGHVTLDGRRTDEDGCAFRRRLGSVPEDPQIYTHLTAPEYLRLVGRLRSLSARPLDRRIAAMLELLDLTASSGVPMSSFSKGMRQRVLIAAAILHDPDVLVLDEPFSGLDPVGVDVLSGVLQERARAGVPVVFSSHQLELVERLCEAVAIVNHGRVVATGAVDELRERGGDGHRHVRVQVAGDGDGRWLDSMSGVELVETGPRGVLVRLRDDADPDRVLDAARAAGTVVHFSLERPTLSDLFRAAVAA